MQNFIHMRNYLIPIAASLCLLAGEARAATPEVRTALERGRELFAFGRWSDARHEFLAARAALAPDDRRERLEADYYLAVCAVELGAEDAGAALRAFEAAYPGSVHTDDVRFALGSLYCAEGEMARARETLRGVDRSRLSPSRREQYDIRAGYAAFSEGDYAEAYDFFDRIPAKSPYADHALYYKSYIDYAEGKYGRAKQGFERLRSSSAYRDLVPYYLLQIEFHEGNYRYVVAEGEALARRSVPARRAEIERVVAESWFRLEEYGKTVEHLAAYGEAGGEFDRDASYLMGFALYRTARYPEAVEWLRRACGAEDAVTQNASYHLADCYLRAGDKEAAMQSFAMAADERFDAAVAEDALFNYAKLQYELGGGAFNGAINLLTRYIARYPASPRAAEARTLLIAAYYNSRDYDAAYRAIKSLPSADAEIRAALQKIAYFRGLEAFAAGDLAAAKRSLAESAAVRVSPKYAALNDFWSGEIAFAEGDYAVAAAKYNAYLQRAPRNSAEYPMAWYNLGYCAFARERMAEAGKAFERFLALRPVRDRYRADACNRLGDVRYADRRFDEAVGEYDRAIALGGAEAHYARYKRAVSLGILGRTEEKLRALRGIVAAGEGDYVADASYELGRSLLAQERYGDGAAALEAFVKRFPASSRAVQAYSDLGLAYLNLGERAKSLACYERAVAASPRSQEAREAMQGIRDLYVSQGDVDGYFDYAAKVGLESDLTAVARDSLSFAAARRLYLDGRNEAATESLRNYVAGYPNGYYRTDALYYLSDCYLRSGAREEAIGTLSELAAEGTNPYTVRVLETLSEMTFADRRYDVAAAAYRRLGDVAPTAAGREAAMTGYVRATVAGGDAARIEAMAEEVMARDDAGATALREARFARAEQLRKAGERAQAAKLYEALAAEVRTAEGSAAGYYLLEELYAAGDAAKTEKAVFAYSEREPRAYWLAKAYLLLGDLYAGKGDDFQARATYQSVADGYSPADDGIVAEARERIRKLNR